MIFDSTSYLLTKTGLDVSTLRQDTISTNVANANTDNYKASEVTFEDQLSRAMGTSGGLKMTATDGEHFQAGDATDVKASVVENTSTAVNENGNNVDMDLEMSNLAANQIMYSALTQQANSYLSNVSYVINGGS
jgi:flagellar basal-body rod protein FlgB